ncbi:helix-turn-helix transcriptional regulator [Klebsiella sp. BIGb0407]|uniref:helix-turn-helix domain-containing protein n=1 Tax=Klebsiella sp. BIGb0407 TaxID=2940603 RepID=UPI00216912A1|nr:LuxR C-terminal-related transcriptional regulator [Klebsiella sp. BIGb0407]MCS3432300.1 DNA-binding CsgD family transcriptional regulator [Klebsiella sp. BIGb0407]
MNLSKNIFSKDKYFTLGIIELLGVELIDNFYVIVDLDSNSLSSEDLIYFPDRKVVAFASSDLAFYKSESFEKVTVLDKKCNAKSILDFFLKKEISGGYHTKFNLSMREKQILSMLCRGESNQEIADEFGITIKTIYTHRRNLMRKLGFKNRMAFQKLYI